MSPNVLGSIGLIIFIILGMIIWWIKSVYDQKRKNQINEIKLVGEKINLDIDSKSISDLVNESNKDHGMGPKT